MSELQTFSPKICNEGLHKTFIPVVDQCPFAKEKPQRKNITVQQKLDDNRVIIQL